jgi:hypothetical protein
MVRAPRADARHGQVMTRTTGRECPRTGCDSDHKHARRGARAEGLHVYAEEDRRLRLDYALCVAVLLLVPWLRSDQQARCVGFIRHRPATKLPHVKALAALLTRPEHGHIKLGAIGSVAPAFLTVCISGLTGARSYCYGGRLVADLDQTGMLACGVYAHPSLMKKADLDKLSAPASFALAESDGAFDGSFIAHAKTALNGSVANELVVYPVTCHGFAARGDLNIESVRQGVEGAHAQAVDWFRKYLL